MVTDLLKHSHHWNCVVLGGGGHARVLVDTILTSGIARVVAVLDQNRELWGRNLLGVPLPGSDDMLASLISQGVNSFVVGVGSVGDPSSRIRLFEKALSFRLEPLIVIHPSAIVSKWAEIGKGSMLYPGSIANASARIGQNVIINTGAIIEHDCVIGDHTHIATGVRLSGTVTIGARAHIGIGSIIRQNIVIGDDVVVGAGAVVVNDVPAGMTVVGNPARTLPKSPLG